MTKKTDWVKIIAIVLAIYFFVLWAINSFAFEVLEIRCQDEMQDLHYQWENTRMTLVNCYENNLETCKYSIPLTPSLK